MIETIVKRDGRREPYKEDKVRSAISKAFVEVDSALTAADKAIIQHITSEITSIGEHENFSMKVEDIQDIVENKLMQSSRKDVAKAYIRYRYDREKNRAIKKKFEERFEQIRSLTKGTNEEANVENSNKDTRIIPTQRDYIAGFACREYAETLIPKDVWDAHKKGKIHFHDTDYSPVMPITNCCLVNLEDMLQNGTVINGTKIDKPKSFLTACTVMSQIAAQVSSSQYGGQTMSLAHLAPFVNISRQKIRNEIEHDFLSLRKYSPSDEYQKMLDAKITEIVEERVRKEVASGIQTIQYQIITISGTNGQAPFISLFMYLDEVPEGQTRDDLALIIEETLKQRIKGVKNRNGVYVTTAFPKLLYCLDEDNIHENSKYWYLTKLAAECSSKRLVPDYISAKIMRKLKGDVYPCINKICA